MAKLSKKVWRLSGTVTIEKMAKRFGVSTMEIRAAYDEAYEEGLADRCAAYDAAMLGRWSDDDKRIISDMYNSGVSYENIAAKLRADVGDVWGILRIMVKSGETEQTGLHRVIRRERLTKRWTRQEETRLMRMYRRGVPLDELAEVFGRSEPSIKTKVHIMRARGLVRKRPRRRRKRIGL